MYNEQNDVSKSVFCVFCGTNLTENDIFCFNCGKPVEESPYSSNTQSLFVSSAPTPPLTPPPVQYTPPPVAPPPPPLPPQTQYTPPPPVQPITQPLHSDQQSPHSPPLQQQQYQPFKQQPHLYPPQSPPPPVQPPFNQTQQKPVGKKKISTTTAVVSIAAAFIVLLSVGLFLFFDPLDFFNRSSSPSGQGGSQNPGDIHQSPEPTAQPTPDSSRAVENILIEHMGNTVIVLELMKGDNTTLHLTLEPNVAIANIEWTSSDKNIFNVIPTGTRGTEARIEAVSEGVATLSVKSGDTIRECIIIVHKEESPDYHDSQLSEFFENINNTNMELRLIVYWVDGPQEGRESIYYRERHSNVWMIRRVTGVVDEIDPEFGFSDGALTISWPVMDYNRTHFFFEDGTGYFSKDYRHANSVYENLSWIIIIG